MIDDENCQVAGRKSLMLCVVSFSAHWYSSELSTYAHPVRMSGLTNELPSDLPLTRAASELCRGTGHRLRLCKRHQRVRGAGQAGRRPWHRVLRPLQRCAHMAAEVPCGKPCWDWTCPWMSTRCLRAVSACASIARTHCCRGPNTPAPKSPKAMRAACLPNGRLDKRCQLSSSRRCAPSALQRPRRLRGAAGHKERDGDVGTGV